MKYDNLPQEPIHHESYDLGYEQGRADALTSNGINIYVDKIRADAIEEVCKQISERVEYWDSCAKAMEKGSNEYKIFISLAKNFDELAEQLKEQKE